MAIKIEHEGFIRIVYTYSNNSIDGVMIYFSNKDNFVETQYNTNNIQMLCI